MNNIRYFTLISILSIATSSHAADNTPPSSPLSTTSSPSPTNEGLSTVAMIRVSPPPLVIVDDRPLKCFFIGREKDELRLCSLAYHAEQAELNEELAKLKERNKLKKAAAQSKLEQSKKDYYDYLVELEQVLLARRSAATSGKYS